MSLSRVDGWRAKLPLSRSRTRAPALWTAVARRAPRPDCPPSGRGARHRFGCPAARRLGGSAFCVPKCPHYHRRLAARGMPGTRRQGPGKVAGPSRSRSALGRTPGSGANWACDRSTALASPARRKSGRGSARSESRQLPIAGPTPGRSAHVGPKSVGTFLRASRPNRPVRQRPGRGGSRPLRRELWREAAGPWVCGAPSRP